MKICQKKEWGSYAVIESSWPTWWVADALVDISDIWETEDAIDLGVLFGGESLSRTCRRVASSPTHSPGKQTIIVNLYRAALTHVKNNINQLSLVLSTKIALLYDIHIYDKLFKSITEA